MKVLVGLPIFDRTWILEHWFRCFENQTMPLSDMGFIFELGPRDDETHEMLWQWHMDHPEVRVFDGIIREDEVHKSHQEDKRGWEFSDFYRMVTFRNNLLERAVGMQPERYFSLDSDMLIEDPNTIETLYQITETSGTTAAPLAYMTPHNTAFPNMMSWVDRPGGKAHRILQDYRLGFVFEVDVSMACVMMSREVYNDVRYRWHRQGEDLGWSAEVKRAGYRMFSASQIYVPHIMHKWMLNDYLINGDKRANLIAS